METKLIYILDRRPTFFECVGAVLKNEELLAQFDRMCGTKFMSKKKPLHALELMVDKATGYDKIRAEIRSKELSDEFHKLCTLTWGLGWIRLHPSTRRTTHENEVVLSAIYSDSYENIGDEKE